jgi:predicted lipoprotein with Yx(FWY)xxD motif
MKWTVLCLLPAAFIFSSSCKREPQNTPKPRTDIHLDSNVTVGKHIVDKDGRSLYYFSNDVNGQSACTGGCLTNWPVFFADTTTTTFSDGLLAADFKTITTTTGAKQTTYKGWPLYYYSPSGIAELAGETKGEGVGGIWFVAKSNYSITIANYQLTGANGTNYLSNYTAGDGRTNYLCDEKGNTLYFFAKDSLYKNKYTKSDFSNNAVWPVYETDNITVPSTLDKSLFKVVVFNGRNQLTYKGWPLYFYGPDGFVRGINKGITIPPTLPVGSLWPVANKDVVTAPN